MTVDAFAAVMTGALLLASFWFVRQAARTKSDRRVQQLTQAAEMLSLHARAMEQFLAAPNAPLMLKRLLVAASDALGDRDVVRRLAEWMSADPGGKRPLADEDAALLGVLQDLHSGQPELHDLFASAMLALAFGATLRWPETALLSEQFGISAARNPKLDFDVAVAAANIRSGLFGVPAGGMAAA